MISTGQCKSPPLPSASWKGAANGFSSTATLAWEAFQSLNFSLISDHLSGLRHGLTCKISDQFTNGSQNLIIEAVFEDDVVWIARIKLSKELLPHERAVLESEVHVMRVVRSRTTIPVPEVYSWGCDRDNVFGAPFILMQGVAGRNFCNDPCFDSVKYKVLDQMASILIQLSLIRFPAIGSLTVEDNISSIVIDGNPAGPFTSAADYYLQFVSCYEKRAEGITEENDRNQMLSICAFYRSTAIPHFVRSLGPFPMINADFGLHNLLINDNGDVVAVIDWANSGTAPWESFAIFPLPISVLWTKRAKYPTPRWEQLISDQKFFVNALQKYEKQFYTDSIVSSLIGSRSVIAAEGFEALMYDARQANRWSDIIKELVCIDSAENSS